MKKYLLKRPVEAVEMDFGWLVSFDTLDGRYIARVDFGRGDFHDLFVEVTEETPDWKDSRKDLDPEIETLIGENLEDLI